MRQMILTDKAPAPIGSYSQAIKAGNSIYISGQIPLDPVSMVVELEPAAAVRLVFDNMKAIAEAAGGSLDQVVRLTVYLTDLALMGLVNEAIEGCFIKPYPARTSIQVAALPRGVSVEIEALMVLN